MEQYIKGDQTEGYIKMECSDWIHFELECSNWIYFEWSVLIGYILNGMF